VKIVEAAHETLEITDSIPVDIHVTGHGKAINNGILVPKVVDHVPPRYPIDCQPPFPQIQRDKMRWASSKPANSHAIGRARFFMSIGFQKFNDKLSIHSIARLYIGLGVSFGKVAAELLDLHENC
jgi:hypothetical protein